MTAAMVHALQGLAVVACLVVVLSLVVLAVALHTAHRSPRAGFGGTDNKDEFYG